MKRSLIFSSRLSLAFGLKILNLIFQIISIIFVAKFFSEKELGIYYLIMSLFGLQLISDLGFSKTMAIFISHESHKLKLENNLLIGPVRSLSRVILVFNLVLTWFKKSSIILFLIYLFLGSFFFLYKDSNFDLFKLWILLSLISCFSIFSPLIFGFFEGINNINRANIFSSAQLIISNLFFLLSIDKFGVYSILMKSIGGLVILLIYIYYHRKLFEQLTVFRKVEVKLKNQFRDQQKKFALTSIMGYLALGTFVPFSYYFISSEFSGKLGFSLQIVNTLSNFLFVFFTINYPLISQDIAERKYNSARDKFYFIIKIVLSLYLFGSLMFFALNDLISFFTNNRLLSTNFIIILFISGILLTSVQLLSSYLRLFKKEYFLKHAFFSAIFSITLLFTIGYNYSENGVFISYLLITFFQFIYAFIIFIKHSNHAST
jgi:O-antigen/teichoic acid export membrane protein